jgi:predicted DNA-binding transcriptional regulator YafY
MSLKVADNKELVGWILSFDSQVRVIDPGALKENVKVEAKEILRS